MHCIKASISCEGTVDISTTNLMISSSHHTMRRYRKSTGAPYKIFEEVCFIQLK